MASPDQTLATPWSQSWHPVAHEKPFAFHAKTIPIAPVGAYGWRSDDVYELVITCLRNVWVYISIVAFLVPFTAAQLLPYCLPVAFISLLASLFMGSLSITRKLRGEIARSFAPSPYDVAVREVVTRILAKFNAKERAVLRAIVVCEPWNRWKHLPNVGVPLYEQFEIIYKALNEQLIVESPAGEEFVRFVPQYVEAAKDMLFSSELRSLQRQRFM